MAAMVAAVSSCSKNEVAVNTSNSNAISFSTYTGVSTKGSILSTATLVDGFGVLAYDQGSKGLFDTDNSTPNFMYNTEVTSANSGSSWTYSPVKYWSSDSENTYSFFGYAPYTGDVTYTAYADADATATATPLVLSGNGTEETEGTDDGYTGTPTATLTIAAAASDMVDFVAGQVLNINKYGQVYSTDATLTSSTASAATVAMNFKHQLTRVSFSAKADTHTTDAGITDTYVNITSIRLLGIAPLSPIAITANGASVSVGDAYDDAYASTDLYSAGTYTFNATETTDGVKTDHDQDGQWSDMTIISNGYDAASILATVTPNTDVEEFEDTDYDTEGVLVKCSDETLSIGTPLFVTAADADETSGTDAVDAQYLFLIPPVISDDAYATGIDNTNTTIQVEIIYDIVTLDPSVDGGVVRSSENNLAIAKLPTDTGTDENPYSLLQGHAYNFLITISGSSITDPTKDPETTTDEDAFDAVVITGNVVEWDETYLDTYQFTM